MRGWLGEESHREKSEEKDAWSSHVKAVDWVLELFGNEPDWGGVEERDAGGRFQDLIS